MRLKYIFTRRRLLLLPTTALLCLIIVELTQHPLTKYHVPFVGWILAFREYSHAHASYWQAINEGLPPSWQHYCATQTAYTHTYIASLSIVAVLTLALIVTNRLWRRTSR